MTTIAWDGKTLSADGQSTSGSTIVGTYVKKINTEIAPDLKVDGSQVVAIALSGTCGDEYHVAKMLRSSVLEMHRELQFEAVVFTENGKCTVVYKGKDTELAKVWDQEPPYAIGSGRDFALAAMAMGKDSYDAVMFAADFDIYTNDNVVTIRPGVKP